MIIPVKRLAAVTLLAALFLAVCVAGSALSGQMKVQAADSETEGVDTNDPLYTKYHSRSILSAGSSYNIAQAQKKLSHQSVFGSKYDKAYGIDVSKWDDEINWKKVKKAGVDFAIIRLGYRGSKNGTLTLDPRFVENIEGAHEAGVAIGIYFFTQAITTSEAKKEAEYCISNLKKYKSYVSYPVMIDIEPYPGRFENANLSKSKKTAIVDKFCETMENGGYTGGVYTSKSFYSSWLNAAELENKYYIWMAHYTDSTDYSGRYDMWQFSSNCNVDGISTKVDMNVAYNLITPDFPKKITQTAIGEDSLSLEWTAVVAADGYKVYRYDASGKQEKTYKTTEPLLALSGLETDKMYRFKVRCFYTKTDGTNKYSKYTPMFQAYTMPGQTKGVTTASRTDTSVTIKWTANSDMDGYRVRFYDAETVSYTTIKSVTTNSYTISGLKAKKDYQIVVQPYVKMNGETKKYGICSKVTDISTGTPKVTGVKFSALNTKSFKFSWKKQSSVAGYQVVWYDSSGKKIGSIDTKAGSQVIKGLKAGNRYKVKVRAYHINTLQKRINGVYSETLKVYTRPAKATGLKQKTAQTDSITLKWSQKTGAVGYRLYMYDSKSKTYKSVKATKERTYTKKGLDTARKYKFKVRAYVENNGKKYYGDYSSVYTAVTRPADVQRFTLTKRTSSTATLSWKKVSRASGYQIRVYDSKKRLKATYETKKTTYKLKKLSGRYTVKIRAISSSKLVKTYSAQNTKLVIPAK